MANPPAPALVLRPADREELERWVRASTVPASAAKRARIVLLAADGVANTRIAELVDATVTTVLGWRERYQSKGLAGLANAPCPGRPWTLDHRAIVADVETTAEEVRGDALVVPVTRRPAEDQQHLGRPRMAGLRHEALEGRVVPVLHRPELVGNVTDICRLYLAPPENAIVLCVVREPVLEEELTTDLIEAAGHRAMSSTRVRSKVRPKRCGSGETGRDLV